jgi:hypothetical protein
MNGFICLRTVGAVWGIYFGEVEEMLIQWNMVSSETDDETSETFGEGGGELDE